MHAHARARPRGVGTHERRLARYCVVDLLIIDDLGLRGLSGDEPLDLYEIIRQRYERGRRSSPPTARSKSGPRSSRRAAGQRRDGPAAAPRSRHRDHREVVPQPDAGEGRLIECPGRRNGSARARLRRVTDPTLNGP